MQNSAMDGVDTGATLQLPVSLDLAAAEDFLSAMQQYVPGKISLRLDASAVETLTLPCVQIVLAAARDCGRISVVDPSAAFLGAFEDLGINWTDFLDVMEERLADEGRLPPEIPESDAAAIHVAPDMTDEAASAENSDANAQPNSEESMSKRIMTIDDSKTMRDMLMLTLADAGFDVLQAVDGQDGLDKLEGEQVDVVITDINMPRMDGYEVIRQLRKKPAFRSTPILVLTTESEVEKRTLAREAGATGWMVKPFDPDRLVETVRKVAP